MSRVAQLPARGVSVAGPAIASATAAAVTALLVSTGRWYLAAACLLAVPAFALLDRYPLAVVSVWLVLAPLVAVTDSTSNRKVFWVVHRGLPVATLGLILFGSLVGIAVRRLPRLGPPELMMAGYVLVSFLSVAYTATDPQASAFRLYDAVVVPMCLYLLVRVVEPDEAALKRLVPAVVFLLLTQSLIGIVAWAAPGMLPAVWLGKLGERTAGSLRSPDVFATTVLFCGVFLLATALSARGLVRRAGPVLLFGLALIMVLLTYSRASWLAGLVALAGVLVLARGSLAHIAVILVPFALFLSASGLLSGPVENARTRLESEESDESALSRLPVAYAALRMFEAKPAVGFGYENFDRYDRQYQQTVGNLVAPGKDHSSHNLYLTVLAEQGILGLFLYTGPMFWWLGRTKSRWRYLRAEGLLGRRLVAALWLVIAGHVIVNNFSRMQVPFGLGIYWLTLGLIASIVSRVSRDRFAEAQVS